MYKAHFVNLEGSSQPTYLNGTYPTLEQIRNYCSHFGIWADVCDESNRYIRVCSYNNEGSIIEGSINTLAIVPEDLSLLSKKELLERSEELLVAVEKVCSGRAVVGGVYLFNLIKYMANLQQELAKYLDKEEE